MTEDSTTAPNDTSLLMEEGGAKKQTSTLKPKSSDASKGTSSPPIFPTPQYIFNLFSPREFKTSEQNISKHELIKSRWKPFSTSTFTSSETRKVKVKLSSLVIKMLNRLIKEKILPREAINILIGQSHIFVQILCTNSLLPVLMQRCERIGVGNVVGACFANPLETSNIPPPGPAEPFDLKQLLTVPEKALGALGGESANTAPLTVEPSADDDDYISSDEEEDEDDKATKDSLPSSVGVPFLSPQRKKELAQKIIDARNEWLQTASNIRVEQVAEEVRAGAAMTLDYTMFVICAATVAAIGLATDSATTTIASMLISPIMGPVMGFTFGTTIRRKRLCLVSLRNEMLSLAICVFVGCFWAIIAAVSNAPENRDWPSQEMLARGDPFGLSSGIMIALPSGVATALSTLGKNSNGMVGVAISLSLLPPAVNAGLCWVYAAMLKAPGIHRNEGDGTDYVVTGGISLALSLLNILCIWISGVFTFWLKEVAPVSRKNAFWSRDIQNYREQDEGSSLTVDTEIINEGIQAALELQQDAGIEIYDRDFDIDLNSIEVGAARREGLASNAWENAVFINQDFGMGGKPVVGGAAAEAIPDASKLENVKRRKTATASLLQAADQLGGLGEAGEALFDNTLLQEIPEDMPLPSDADGVNHEDVAKKILLQKYD